MQECGSEGMWESRHEMRECGCAGMREWECGSVRGVNDCRLWTVDCRLIDCAIEWKRL